MQNILIIKIGAIGDVAMAFPMISEIRRRWPEARLTWVCGKVVAPLVRLSPDVNDVIVVDESHLFGRNFLKRLTALARIWRKLMLRHFDLVCIGHRDRRYRLIALPCSGDIVRSFGGARGGPIPGRHHSHEYVRLVTGVDGPQAPPATPPNLTLPQIGNLLAAGIVPTILFPGGAANVLRTSAMRRWPLENYALLADKLIAAGHRVVIAGAPSDDYVRPTFDGKNVIDMIGKTSLPELMTLFAMAKVIVSHDTAAVHLANLVDVPIVALFGPTNMHDFLFPRLKAIGLWGGEALPCRPCYDGREFHPCETVACMRSITPEQVMSGVTELTREASHG